MTRRTSVVMTALGGALVMAASLAAVALMRSGPAASEPASGSPGRDRITAGGSATPDDSLNAVPTTASASSPAASSPDATRPAGPTTPAATPATGPVKANPGPPVPPPPPAGGSGWRLVWADEFNGSGLDPARWNARNNTYVDYDLACITNRSQNVAVADGMLILRAQQESYTCGSQSRQYTAPYLDTNGKASFTYGAFETRAKSPNGPSNSTGLWPAFWMRPNDGGKGEIDVTELPGGTSYYRAATQAIFYDYTPIKQDHRHTFASGYPGDGFHTYRTEWEPGVLRWYIDGAEVYRRDRGTTPWLDEAFSRPFHLRLNVQVGGWLGNPNAGTTFPAEFQVDYVHVWQR